MKHLTTNNEQYTISGGPLIMFYSQGFLFIKVINIINIYQNNIKSIYDKYVNYKKV